MDVVRQLDEMPTDIWLLRKRMMVLPKTLGEEAPSLLAALRAQRGTKAREQLAADLVFAWRAFPGLWNMPHPCEN